MKISRFNDFINEKKSCCGKCTSKKGCKCCKNCECSKSSDDSCSSCGDVGCHLCMSTTKYPKQIKESETIEGDTDPWYEPEWCEECSADAEENGFEYEPNFTWRNGCWECDNCRRPV